MNCLFGGDFFAMSINRCMQCGCKSSLEHPRKITRTHIFFIFSACVMLVHRLRTNKAAWTFRRISIHGLLFSDSLWLFTSHFVLISIDIFADIPNSFFKWYSTAISKSVWWRTMNICVLRHYPIYMDIWKTFEMFAICKVDN